MKYLWILAGSLIAVGIVFLGGRLLIVMFPPGEIDIHERLSRQIPHTNDEEGKE